MRIENVERRKKRTVKNKKKNYRGELMNKKDKKRRMKMKDTKKFCLRLNKRKSEN